MEKYTLLLDVTKNMLGTLNHLLDKADAHVKEQGVQESDLLQAALAPDMFNFTKQVQVATDDARRNLRLLAGKEHIKMEDTETTIAQLKDRVKRTQDIISELSINDFKDADTRQVSLYWMGEMGVDGKDFVAQLAVPNFLFHVITAYAILRKEGLNIGKQDFITVLHMKPKATS